jgi:hypothetical protein
MQRKAINKKLEEVGFDFFYRFSRFEFALKENGYLKSTKPGAAVEPGWDAFVKKWFDSYSISKEGSQLLSAKPQHQVVGTSGELEWDDVNLSDCKSDLARVIRLLKTVRNNLFHGGKHQAKSWDNPKRTQKLLALGTTVLGQLAHLASIEPDYDRLY